MSDERLREQALKIVEVLKRYGATNIRVINDYSFYCAYRGYGIKFVNQNGRICATVHGPDCDCEPTLYGPPTSTVAALLRRIDAVVDDDLKQQLQSKGFWARRRANREYRDRLRALAQKELDPGVDMSAPSPYLEFIRGR